MAQTPLQPNYMKVFIQRDYSEGEEIKDYLQQIVELMINDEYCRNFSAIPEQISK
jgi:hypothetical protein